MNVVSNTSDLDPSLQGYFMTMSCIADREILRPDSCTILSPAVAAFNRPTFPSAFTESVTVLLACLGGHPISYSFVHRLHGT